MQPVWGVGQAQDADVLTVLANAANESRGTSRTTVTGAPSAAAGDGAVAEPITASDILGYDIVVADSQAPELIGAQRTLLASGRLDNLTSVFAGLRALIEHAHDLESAEHVSVLAAFDHEEVGSAKIGRASCRERVSLVV